MSSKPFDSLHYVNWPVEKVLAFSSTRQFPIPSPGNVKHKTTKSCSRHINKQQLASSPPFDAFNLGLHVGDKATSVQSNRDYLAQVIRNSNTKSHNTKPNIQWLEQVHGNSVAIVDIHQKMPIVADAAITQNPNIALAIMTADCLPILITNQSGTKVAAIHAGWRPLATNIVEKTIATIAEPVNQLYAWLGPCIGKNAFEVGEDVRSIFINQSIFFKQMFYAKASSISENKYFCDLAAIAKYKLLLLGVENITHLDHCTFDRKSEYFSYRRDNQTGRMGSIIKITQ